MKTITMDYETYQKEIGIAKSAKDKGFDEGSIAASKRLEPIMNYLREIVTHDRSFSQKTLEALMHEAGEL